MIFESVQVGAVQQQTSARVPKPARTLTTLWVPHFLQSNSTPPLDSSCFLPFLPLPSPPLAEPSALSGLRRRISGLDLLVICC